MNSSGTRIAIGAPLNNGNGNDSGHVRVYQLDDPYDMALANPPSIDNINFSKPVISDNSHQYLFSYTNEGNGWSSQPNYNKPNPPVDGWVVGEGDHGGGVILANNSSTWTFTEQAYPNNTPTDSQCIILQKTAWFKTSNTNIFYPGVKYNLSFNARGRYRTFVNLNYGNPIKVGFADKSPFFTTDEPLVTEWKSYSIDFFSDTIEPQQISFTGSQQNSDWSSGILNIEITIVEPI